MFGYGTKLSRPAFRVGGSVLPFAPKLDLNFAANTYVGASLADITFTRNSISYAADVSGNWISFANNVPRITNKGFLPEESRTNGIRNNSMQGAVTGTPGTPPTNWFIVSQNGLSTTIVGTGVDQGIDYIDLRVFGTANSTNQVVVGFEQGNTIVSANGQFWAGSAFVKLVGGSTSNITAFNLTLAENTSTGAFVVGSNYAQPAPTSSWQRYTARRQLSGGTTATAIQSSLALPSNSGSAVDITLRIGWPQLEQGQFVTSPIRTTGSAVTRPADVAYISGTPFTNFYTSGTGTLYALASDIYDVPPVNATGIPVACSLDDGTSSNRIVLRRTDNNGTIQGAFVVVSGGTTVQNLPVSSAMTTHPNDLSQVGAWATNDMRGATYGVLGGTGTSGTPPSALTRLSLGHTAGANQLNGYLKRVGYWNTRQSNNNLIALTS